MPSSPFDGVRAVAFDLDCTLVDVLAVKRAGAAAAARALGADPEALYAHALVRGIDRDDHVTSFAPRGPPDRLARAEAAFLRAEDAACEPYEGVRELLPSLASRGFLLALVTDAPRAQAERRLAASGLSRWFPTRVTIEDSPRGKLGVEPFERAAAMLGVEACDVLMVGDHPARDVASARRAGCRAVLARYGGGERFATGHPDEVPDASIGKPLALLDLLRAERTAASAKSTSAALAWA